MGDRSGSSDLISPGRGNGHGGRRVGAGRPAGATNVLPHGAVKALKVLGLRVPKDAPREQRELADRAFSRIVDVMDARVHRAAMFPVLQAARAVREEICGKVADKVDVTVRSHAQLVAEAAGEDPKGALPAVGGKA